MHSFYWSVWLSKVMLGHLDVSVLTCQMLREPFQDVCRVQTSTHPHCGGAFSLLQLHLQQGEESGGRRDVSALRLQDYSRCGGKLCLGLVSIAPRFKIKALAAFCDACVTCTSSFQSTSKADKSSGASRGRNFFFTTN